MPSASTAVMTGAGSRQGIGATRSMKVVPSARERHGDTAVDVHLSHRAEHFFGQHERLACRRNHAAVSCDT
jgi:hypothetical protein